MSPQVDEETPLLRSQQYKKKVTPLPWAQLCIVLFLQLAEPLTSQVIYPFAPQLIRDIGITNGNESQVGYYVGLMQSLFFLCQAMTVLHWSRVSDTIGRKPVLLIGLFGLSVSMFCFGLSRTFWGLVLSRTLNGALNGNIGVMKSMMAEMTDSTNISKAYAYWPIPWSLGGTLGPLIGGSLSRPAEQFPHLFGNNEFLKKYPYFLPCAVPATFTIIAWIVTFLFLKETVQSPISLSQMLGVHNDKTKSTDTLHDPSADEDPTGLAKPGPTKPLPLRSVLTRKVIIAGSNYACLSLVDIAFRAIQPVYFSTPIELGGLGLPPSKIGSILAVFGILNGLFQIFFFARLHDYWGSKKVFIAGLTTAIPVFVLFPVMNYIARAQGLNDTVWVLVFLQIVISIGLSLSYGAVFIFITNASPNRASLGATNGVCQMVVSTMRAVGPASATSLFSVTIEKNLLGGYFVYYLLVAVVCLSLVVSTMLPSTRRAVGS